MDDVGVLAEVWAEMDGRGNEFRLERDNPVNGGDGTYQGYRADAEEMLRRIHKRGYYMAETVC